MSKRIKNYLYILIVILVFLSFYLLWLRPIPTEIDGKSSYDIKSDPLTGGANEEQLKKVGESKVRSSKNIDRAYHDNAGENVKAPSSAGNEKLEQINKGEDKKSLTAPDGSRESQGNGFKERGSSEAGQRRGSFFRGNGKGDSKIFIPSVDENLGPLDEIEDSELLEEPEIETDNLGEGPELDFNFENMEPPGEVIGNDDRFDFEGPDMN